MPLKSLPGAMESLRVISGRINAWAKYQQLLLARVISDYATRMAKRLLVVR